MSDPNQVPPTPPPSEELTPYQRRDLALKEQALTHQTWQRWTAFWSLLVSVIGFGLVVCTLLNNNEALRNNVQQLRNNELALQTNGLALRNNVQQSMTKLTVDLDRLFVDHPDLRPYFNDAVNPYGQTNFPAASETAYLMLDVFDLAIGQAGTFKDQWTEAKGWTNWVADEFARSPFLRNQYELHPGWYGKEMRGLEQNTNLIRNGTNYYIANYQPPK